MSEIIVNPIEAKAGRGTYCIASEGIMSARRILIDKMRDTKVQNWKALAELEKSLTAIWKNNHKRYWEVIL